MPISPTDFVFSLTPNPLQAVIGLNTAAQFSFSNTNLVDKAFNLSLTATLPDGVSFVSSAVVPTQIVNNPDGTITLTWINVKDLAPNELNYILGVTLKSDDTFRATGLLVPFDVPLVTVGAAATVDTLPRGNDDPGNVKITKNDNANFIPLRYSLTKSVAYSGRNQVPVDFGTPNITLTKNVTEPDVNAIKAGETYTYSITIASPQIPSVIQSVYKLAKRDAICVNIWYNTRVREEVKCHYHKKKRNAHMQTI